MRVKLVVSYWLDILNTMKQLTPHKKNKILANGAGFTVVEVILMVIAIAIFIGVVFVAFNRGH